MANVLVFSVKIYEYVIQVNISETFALPKQTFYHKLEHHRRVF